MLILELRGLGTYLFNVIKSKSWAKYVVATVKTVKRDIMLCFFRHVLLLTGTFQEASYFKA